MTIGKINSPFFHHKEKHSVVGTNTCGDTFSKTIKSL